MPRISTILIQPQAASVAVAADDPRTVVVEVSPPAGAPGAPGPPGAPGAPGSAIELRTNDTHIQWRVVGAETWLDLIALAEITGADGEAGAPGAAGADGRDLELQVAADNILQWRYVGEGSWTTLLDLDTLSNYTLPPAGLTTLGGVKRNAGAAGQFVSGVAEDGSLTYGTPSGVELPLPVSAGGTGATTANSALVELGVTETVPAVAQEVFVNFLADGYPPYSGTFVDIGAPGDIVRFWFSSGAEVAPDAPPGGRLVEVALTGETASDNAAALRLAVAAQAETFAAGGNDSQVTIKNLVAGPSSLMVSSYTYLNAGIFTHGSSAYDRLLGNGEVVTSVNAALLDGYTSDELLSIAQATAQTVASSAVASGRGLTLLASATANNVASITWDGLLTSNYDSYLLVAEGIRPATDNVALRVILRASGADMTSTYRWAYTNQPLTAGSPTNVTNQNATTGWTPLGADLGNDTNEQSSLEMVIHPRNGIWKQMTARGVALNTATQAWSRIGGGIMESTTNADGLRITMSSGNIATGRFKLFGLKRV